MLQLVKALFFESSTREPYRSDAVVNRGWVRSAYREIDDWNGRPGTQKVMCLALYRWEKHDKWAISDKPGVIADWKAAMTHKYPSPSAVQDGGTKPPPASPVYIPVVQAGGSVVVPPAPTLPARAWDSRLDARGVRIVEANVTAGQTYWRVVRGEWLDEAQSQGRHHIYVDVRDEGGGRVVGVPLKILWPGGTARIVTEAKPGEPYSANFPMSPSRNEFQVVVDDGSPSDAVIGIGMGAETPGGFNAGIHTSTSVVFRRAEAPKTAQEPPKNEGGTDMPKTPAAPQPGVSAPPSGTVDPAVAAAVLAVESGGKAFGADGRVVIRFENHIFGGRLGDAALYAAHFAHDAAKPWTGHNWRPSPGGPWRPTHTGRQADEWAAYEFAATLGAEAAAQSLGMGAAQIMGFNHARVGYSTARAMLDAFEQGEANQIVAFLNFLLSDPALWAAVRARDWRTVARLYNGPGQIDYYAGLLAQAYARLRGG